MDVKSFYEQYGEVLKIRDKWDYYAQNSDLVQIDELFKEKNALSFIKNIFVNRGKGKALEILYDSSFPMNEYRLNHTISTFLFGILLRDELHIDMRELPKVSDKPTKNFLYFWSFACLFHDYSVAIEDESEKLISDVYTIKAFNKYFEIKYSLIDKSELRELIGRYYKYRIEQSNKVDHGIASAIIFYDAMMKNYHDVKEKAQIQGIRTSKSSFEFNGYKFSNKFENHVRLIANTIARHNMWVANSDTEEVYRDYGLESLIVSRSGNNKISIDENDKDKFIKDKLLFLLALVDTLEPIKNLGRSNNINPVTNAYMVLEKIKVGLRYKSKERVVVIGCPEGHLEDYKKSISGIDDWMDVKCEQCNKQIRIIITD